MRRCFAGTSSHEFTRKSPLVVSDGLTTHTAQHTKPNDPHLSRAMRPPEIPGSRALIAPSFHVKPRACARENRIVDHRDSIDFRGFPAARARRPEADGEGTGHGRQFHVKPTVSVRMPRRGKYHDPRRGLLERGEFRDHLDVCLRPISRPPTTRERCRSPGAGPPSWCIYQPRGQHRRKPSRTRRRRG